MRNCIILFACTLFLSGCVNNQGSVGQDLSSKFDYIDISEVNHDIENALKADYDQLELVGVEDIVIPMELYKLSFKGQNEFGDTNTAFSIFVDNTILEELGDYEEKEDQFGGKSRIIDDEERKYYLCQGADGLLTYASPIAYDNAFNPYENVAIYHVDRGENCDVTYELQDKKYSVSAAVDDVNRWLKENYSMVAPNYDTRVKTVIVRRYNNKYIFEFTIENTFMGLSIGSRYPVSILDEQTQDINIVLFPSRIDILMYNASKIDVFTNEGSASSADIVDEYKEIISLSSALSYCEDYFSDYGKIIINNICLKYIRSNKMSEGVREGRLMWELITDVPVYEYCPSGTVNTYGDISKYIYIDAISGELYYDFEITLE